jgi:hypothetical protein
MRDHVSPGRLAAFRVAQGAMTLGAAAAALPVVLGIGQVRSEIAGRFGASAAVVLTTAALSALLARLLLHARTGTRAAFGCALGGGIFGILNAGLCLMFVQLLNADGLSVAARLSTAPSALATGTVFGGIYGGPLGFAFGLAFSPLVLYWVEQGRRPSLDAPDRMLCAAGSWLAVVAGLSACLAEALDVRAPACLSAGLVGVGLFGVALGTARLRARKMWLRRVAEGQEPEWQLVPRRPGRDDERLEPFLAATDPVDCDRVLATRSAATPKNGAPYRESPPLRRVALVASSHAS